MAFLLAVYLAMSYILIVVCITAGVTGALVIPWQIYCIDDFIGIITAGLIITALFLVVKVDIQSNELGDKWMRYSAGMRSVTLIQTRQLRKTLSS